jgi:hypothetical protein
LAEQAKILFAEAEENNLGEKVLVERWDRWHTCSLCDQLHHGGVMCALGWACWKTYVGRPEADHGRLNAMRMLGNGLSIANCQEDALSVKEAELSMMLRTGVSKEVMLAIQTNLSTTYRRAGRNEEALRMRRDVYSEYLNIFGTQNRDTVGAASNLAVSLFDLRRFEEAKSLLRKTLPVAQRVLGEDNDITLKMRTTYAQNLFKADGATLDNVREAVATLEETTRIARRVFGGTHPFTLDIEDELRDARAAHEAKGQGA